MKTLHAFVAMPFGKKTEPNRASIGFNAVNKSKRPKPFVEPAFIQKFVILGGQSRRERYFKIKPQTQIKAAPIKSGEPLKALNTSDRYNLLLLNIALSYGIVKVRFVCLNGKVGDAPGVTAHMSHEVNEKTGQVCWFDTRKLW